MFLSPVLSKFAIEKNEENMATITLTLSARTSKDTGKAEILLRYRNTREVALRAHTRVFILPKYFFVNTKTGEKSGEMLATVKLG